jgi:hypothetical protein
VPFVNRRAACEPCPFVRTSFVNPRVLRDSAEEHPLRTDENPKTGAAFTVGVEGSDLLSQVLDGGGEKIATYPVDVLLFRSDFVRSAVRFTQELCVRFRRRGSALRPIGDALGLARERRPIRPDEAFPSAFLAKLRGIRVPVRLCQPAGVRMATTHNVRSRQRTSLGMAPLSTCGGAASESWTVPRH